MPTSKRLERLVVDANPILAALLGGMARRMFFETNIQEFAVPEVTLTEVRGYLPHVARKIGVETKILEFALDLLPLSPYPARTYRQSIAEASRRISKRDPQGCGCPGPHTPFGPSPVVKRSGLRRGGNRIPDHRPPPRHLLRTIRPLSLHLG